MPVANLLVAWQSAKRIFFHSALAPAFHMYQRATMAPLRLTTQSRREHEPRGANDVRRSSTPPHRSRFSADNGKKRRTNFAPIASTRIKILYMFSTKNAEGMRHSHLSATHVMARYCRRLLQSKKALPYPEFYVGIQACAAFLRPVHDRCRIALTQSISAGSVCFVKLDRFLDFFHSRIVHPFSAVDVLANERGEFTSTEKQGKHDDEMSLVRGSWRLEGPQFTFSNASWRCPNDQVQTGRSPPTPRVHCPPVLFVHENNLPVPCSRFASVRASFCIWTMPWIVEAIRFRGSPFLLNTFRPFAAGFLVFFKGSRAPFVRCMHVAVSRCNGHFIVRYIHAAISSCL